MPSQSPGDPLIIDRYAIYAAVAAGGMATVHLARLQGSGGFSRIVAAKRLHPHLAADPDFSAMLIDEARVAARIRHPNVVSTLDVVSTDAELVVVMEYVHGESVAKLASDVHGKGQLIDRRIVGSIVIDALHGLHAAHEAKDERGEPLGIVHRDISPHNLLLGVDGVTRIADFGIAKAAGRVQVTRDQSIKGKLAYMAPEQIQQGPVTPATDVFAASIVLWELLTGRALFAGSTDGETIFNVLQARVPPPSELVPEVPRALDDVLERGLARDPSRRYATAREMARDLEGCIEAMRSSEIGAWVEEVGGEKLRERARQMSDIEGRHLAPRAETPRAARSSAEPAAKTDGTAVKHTRRVQPPPAKPEPTPEAPARAPAERPRAPAPQFESSQVAHVRDQDVPPPPPRRRFVWQGMLAAAALGVALAATFWWPKEPRVSAVLSDAREPASTAASAVTAEPAPSSSPPAPAEIVAETSPAPPVPKPSPATSGKTGRPGHRKPSAQCTPPYTIDSAGRRLFKLECM
jgi:serine/threonine-protein kinase